MKKSLLLLVIVMLGLGTYSIIKAETLTLEVTPGYIAIDSSGSVNIGAISYSPVPAEINQTFPLNSFRMIDKRGGPGYYTTIQFGDLIKGGDSIANNNIQYKTLAEPNIIYAINNSFMRFGSGIENQFNIVNQPMTYFVRKPNERTGAIGLFGDTPDIKITVPAYQTGGTYRGNIYYTLYDIE